jgi:hypothetical protein
MKAASTPNDLLLMVLARPEPSTVGIKRATSPDFPAEAARLSLILPDLQAACGITTHSSIMGRTGTTRNA